ncbi:Tnks [Symbiodinium pilosum]|uniref:Poly [ADP-ribose] polymerase n=1 Tax=Symbiodinium pilosum TaxID=2952 RepID=A0A812Q1Z3_SYMPI|nr:Tnks [Symbiodinium pilosum]
MAILEQFDQRTKVPHLLIELRNQGYIEICGKNMGGIYDKLDSFFKTYFGARDARLVMRHYVVSAAGLQQLGSFGRLPGAYSPIPVQLRKAAAASGKDLVRLGLTMQPKEPCDEVCDKILNRMLVSVDVQNRSQAVINFMTNECGWGLHLADGGNLGYKGPVTMLPDTPHVELPRIQSLRDTGECMRTDFVQRRWGGSVVGDRNSHKDYCDLKFTTSAFKKRGMQGENNLGMKTMEIVDFMTKECAWTLLTCTGGNCGLTGSMREQQMVFRNDAHVQHGDQHLMIELRDQGYVELNGLHDAPEAAQLLDNFYRQQGCQVYQPGFWESSEKFCDVKYQTPAGFYYRAGTTNNLGKRTIEVASYLGNYGWMLLLCNGGNIHAGQQRSGIIREQQVKFTKARPTDNPAAPLLMIELRTIPMNKEGHYQGFIEINGQNTNGVYQQVIQYMQQTMLCTPLGPQPYCDLLLQCNCFRLREATTSWHHLHGRLNGESNFGRYTMRLCDFMVDHLGEWDLIVCNGNSVDSIFRVGKDSTISVNGREQQLIFRHRPGGRNVFMAADVNVAKLGRPPLLPPNYWKESSRTGSVGQEIVPATAEEIAWIQEAMDGTYKKKSTRDRAGGPLADRFVVVSALRSEHPGLWEKFAQRRNHVAKDIKNRSTVEIVEPKTVKACKAFEERCTHPRLGNPTNEAYLFHGSNPTSAISILSTSFKVDFAGAAVGTMFGPGVYLAESSSKSDEYARDENTGGAYDGLFAVLLCRVVVGSSYVVEKPGNYTEKCTSGEFDSVVGDREKAVGTFREFIIFDEASIYPEYVAFYRREYKDGPPAPKAAPAPAAASYAPDQHVMPAARTMQVQIPEGAAPGTRIQAKAPWGATLEIVVPEGVTPGQLITVSA